MTEPVTEDGIESAWNACKYRGYCSRLHVENADVMVERDRLRAEVERLRADGERLDWLAANPREGSIRIGTDMKPVVFWGVSAAPGVDLRFAIDAALKEPK